MAKPKLKTVEAPKIIKLDIGCGPNKKAGFIGIDQYPMEGVDLVLDVASERWPYEDGSIEEAHSSHFLEHLDRFERVVFFNELYRVLRVGGRATIITPHWASSRAYGDFTHQWPGVSEQMWYHLSKEWRKVNAPHTDKKWNPKGYDSDLDFECTWGYGMHGTLLSKNTEYQQFAMQWYKEAAQDMHATCIKK